MGYKVRRAKSHPFILELLLGKEIQKIFLSKKIYCAYSVSSARLGSYKLAYDP